MVSFAAGEKAAGGKNLGTLVAAVCVEAVVVEDVKAVGTISSAETTCSAKIVRGKVKAEGTCMTKGCAEMWLQCM